MMIAIKIDRKHNFKELKICTTNPSLNNSKKDLNACAGEGNRCFCHIVPTNQSAITNAIQTNKIKVFLDFDTFSNGVKNCFIIFLVLKVQRLCNFEPLFL